MIVHSFVGHTDRTDTCRPLTRVCGADWVGGVVTGVTRGRVKKPTASVWVHREGMPRGRGRERKRVVFVLLQLFTALQNQTFFFLTEADGYIDGRGGGGYVHGLYETQGPKAHPKICATAVVSPVSLNPIALQTVAYVHRKHVFCGQTLCSFVACIFFWPGKEVRRS